jgi:hypothetical protein
VSEMDQGRLFSLLTTLDSGSVDRNPVTCSGVVVSLDWRSESLFSSGFDSQETASDSMPVQDDLKRKKLDSDVSRYCPSMGGIGGALLQLVPKLWKVEERGRFLTSWFAAASARDDLQVPPKPFGVLNVSLCRSLSVVEHGRNDLAVSADGGVGVVGFWGPNSLGCAIVPLFMLGTGPRSCSCTCTRLAVLSVC